MTTITKTKSGYIEQLTFEINSKKYYIEVKPYFVRKCYEKTECNIGAIIEHYRSLIDDNDQEAAEEYWNNQNECLEKFLNTVNYPFEKFCPDYIQIFYPDNEHRKSYLKKFKEKLLKNEISNSKDYSKNFFKKDGALSVVKSDNKNEVEFKFEKPSNISKIDNLLIIDDTISTCTTINHFLLELHQNNLLSKNTKIKIIILYNNFKDISVVKLEDDFNLNEFMNENA